jgi:glycosyltransferase involved in cell wall biosynthesis
MSEVFWSIDSLIVKENTISGYGWVFHKHFKITDLILRLTLKLEGLIFSENISLEVGKSREDVARAYNNEHYSRNSGFFILGAFSLYSEIIAVELICQNANGILVHISIPISIIKIHKEINKVRKIQIEARENYILLRRGISLLVGGEFKTLLHKIYRYRKITSTNEIYKSAHIYSLLEKSEKKNICIIIDHDLGGGANHYRDRMVDSLNQDGRTAIILTFHVLSLSHVLIIRNNRINKKYIIKNKSLLLDAVKELVVTDIVYNNAVSFARPEEIPPFLIALKERTSANLKILLHDFFIVCPSHFLIDYLGKFCNLPSPDVCAKCIQSNPYGFTTLFSDRNLQEWRIVWMTALNVADEIIAFSNDTAKVFNKAYPQISSNRISIKPHEVDYLTDFIPEINNTKKLCIGVVGNIGFHKGAEFIGSLARAIKSRGLDLNIVIIGTLDLQCDSPNVGQTGPYQTKELKRLVEQSGVNVMLFPSIWPETFSYVVQELMQMELPIASFNIGAPAERLASYPKGVVLDSMDPYTVLDRLLLFHQNIYLRN